MQSALLNIGQLGCHVLECFDVVNDITDVLELGIVNSPLEHFNVVSLFFPFKIAIVFTLADVGFKIGVVLGWCLFHVLNPMLFIYSWSRRITANFLLVIF